MNASKQDEPKEGNANTHDQQISQSKVPESGFHMVPETIERTDTDADATTPSTATTEGAAGGADANANAGSAVSACTMM